MDVLVVGSLNVDSRAEVERFARGGETIKARSMEISLGGKGGNQAVAAARAGAQVAMLGAVGDDEGGLLHLHGLQAHGVDTSLVDVIPDVPAGAAYICVDATGENTIVISAGANERVDATRLADELAPSVVVLQNEVPEAVNEAAVEFAAGVGARLVVNPAPVPETVPAYLGAADVLVVKEHEAAALAPGSDWSKLLSVTGARSAVVTLGAAGAVVVTGAGSHAIAGVRVDEVIDTTGAGDTFVGALAAHLAQGVSLVEAATHAGEAAAASVRWRSARPPRAASTGGPTG